MRLSLSLAPLLALLVGCEQLGIEDPAKVAAAKEAEGKAIGSACRHAMRAIEDCYTLNPKANKSAVYTGWREMDEYMRENKLEGVAPVVPRPEPKKPKADEEEEEPTPKKADKADKAAKADKPDKASKTASH
ncbi:outer membrane biosynthesis protein TonB [Inhella inkyongensis]|uniref:Outer membrane biosynthesis protein TonB n=1 Tax=Inhella inkyongensis TaxID=392593 RepID=A0A840S705_9BURK|nr:hypothetical protein [Inhella inkyongensis]MBB5206235.1 outer membrane biosynthesis protein TonB [Inhella inkyongensis]